MRVVIIFIYLISVYTTASACTICHTSYTRKRGMEDIYCYKWVFSFFTDDFTEFDIEQSDCCWLVLWIMDKTVIQCKTIIHSPHIVCSNRFRPFSWIPVQSYLKKKIIIITVHYYFYYFTKYTTRTSGILEYKLTTIDEYFDSFER